MGNTCSFHFVCLLKPKSCCRCKKVLTLCAQCCESDSACDTHIDGKKWSRNKQDVLLKTLILKELLFITWVTFALKSKYICISLFDYPNARCIEFKKHSFCLAWVSARSPNRSLALGQDLIYFSASDIIRNLVAQFASTMREQYGSVPCSANYYSLFIEARFIIQAGVVIQTVNWRLGPLSVTWEELFIHIQILSRSTWH